MSTPVHDSPPWGITTKAIVASSFIILTAMVIWRFQFLIMPLTLAGILAYLLHPLIRFLNYRLNIHRTILVITVYVILLLLLLGSSVAIGLVAAEQLTRLAIALPNMVPRLIEQAQAFTNAWADVEFAVGPYEISFGAASDLINWDSLADEVRTVLQQVLGQSTLAIAGAAQATLSTLATALTVFVISIYISMEGPRIGQVISDVAQQPGYRADAERLILDTLRIWNSYLRGQIILALIIFAVVSVSLGILRVNYAIALGILSGVLEFLPIVGPVIGAGAAVLVAFFQTPPWGLSPLTFALIVLAVMVIFQQVEGNILVPRMVGDSVNVHPMLVMIAVLMGASLAGLLGAVLAAPVVGTLKVFAIYVWRKMLDLHPFPDDIPNGMNDDSPVPPDAALAITPPLAGTALTFAPIFKDYVWGGRNLETHLGRALPPGNVAESWEIAAHKNGSSTIETGPLAGMTLAQATAQHGMALLGTRNRESAARGEFPLLIKLLDANRWLSVQVHPDDAYAQQHAGERGKTEMWIVLHAEPGAQVVYGFSRAHTAAELRELLACGDTHAIEDAFHRIPVKAGDVIFVPTGAVHALGPGIIVAEIQQNSDTTYRLYDWGRDRETHIEEALAVLDFNLVQPNLFAPRAVTSADLESEGAVTIERIGRSPYFHVERIHMPRGSTVRGRTHGETFEIYGILQGSARLRVGDAGPDPVATTETSTEADPETDASTQSATHLRLHGVSWTLLPASMGDYCLEADKAQDATLDDSQGETTIAVRIFTPAPRANTNAESAEQQRAEPRASV